MDHLLLRAWREGLPPFHGDTLWAEDMAFEQVVECALWIVLNLEQRTTSQGQLFKLDDWHEHDGFPKEAVVVSLQDIQLALTTPSSLLDFCTDESNVCAAIYPESVEFLWRIGLDEWASDRNVANGSKGQRWRFDFSTANDRLVELRTVLNSVQNIDLNIEPTTHFFNRKSTDLAFKKSQRKRSRRRDQT
jgi:hypothetical protein